MHSDESYQDMHASTLPHHSGPRESNTKRVVLGGPLVFQALIGSQADPHGLRRFSATNRERPRVHQLEYGSLAGREHQRKHGQECERDHAHVSPLSRLFISVDRAVSARVRIHRVLPDQTVGLCV